MIAGQDQGSKRDMRSMTLDGQSLSSMRDFIYLGSAVAADGNEEVEVTRRVEKCVICQEFSVRRWYSHVLWKQEGSCERKIVNMEVGSRRKTQDEMEGLYCGR